VFNKKILAVIALLILVSVGAITVVLSSNTDLTNSLIDNNNKGTIYDYTEGVALTSGEYRETVYNEYTNDYRPLYDGMTQDHYDWYFKDLPAFPKDFFDIANLVYEGKITDYNRLSEKYWKQPEFYPTWFNSVYKYTRHDEKRWRPEGYGCYPNIKEVTTDVRDDTITVSTYFRTAFDTNSYQGLIIHPYLPSSAISMLGNTIFEQPDDAEKYISISINNPDDSIYDSFKNNLPYTNVEPCDWFTILKPTHLIIRDEYNNKIGESGFPSDWVRLLNLDITIAEDTPKGDYVVAIDILTPCFSINQEYYYSTNHEYYGNLYYPAGNYFQRNTPHFQAIIRVV